MRRVRTRAGLTLIEVVFAIAILVVVLLGLGQLVVTNQQARDLARQRAVAMAAAGEKIEELKQLPPGTVSSFHGSEFQVSQSVDGAVRVLRPPTELGPDSVVWSQAGKVFVQRVGSSSFLRVLVWVRWKTPAGVGEHKVVFGVDSP